MYKFSAKIKKMHKENGIGPKPDPWGTPKEVQAGTIKKKLLF